MFRVCLCFVILCWIFFFKWPAFNGQVLLSLCFMALAEERQAKHQDILVISLSHLFGRKTITRIHPKVSVRTSIQDTSGHGGGHGHQLMSGVWFPTDIFTRLITLRRWHRNGNGEIVVVTLHIYGDILVILFGQWIVRQDLSEDIVAIP